MKYHSTRGQAPIADFADVVLTGLARDGGLYVPESYPQFSSDQWRQLRGQSYQAVALAVMAPFVEGAIQPDILKTLIDDTYASFRHQAIAPLKQLDTNHFLLELFHGPTLAFKDYALQLLGRLFDHFLQERGQRLTILGATSGDTGSAAIEACRDKDTIELFMLHPLSRTSEIQRKQMTTVLSKNIHNIALKGPFDECQTIVKALFGDLEFRDRYQLSAVNSINWARILAQVVYYVYAALSLGAPERPVSFVVPTGNFGNVFAAYVAKRMGLPIRKLAVGTNKNDILTRFFDSGKMRTDTVCPSLSPSMDIQISSNFERLLFDAFNRDAARLAATMATFENTGTFSVSPEVLSALRQTFIGGRLDDVGITAVIRDTYQRTGELIDPHTAVACAPHLLQHLMAQEPGTAVVSLACAHPAKFPDAVKTATDLSPALPAFLGNLFEREERLTVLESDRAAVKAFVEERLMAKQSV
ncbi:threonine synthase [Romeria aff. gracilis LEGE 07310]|uniref:Threonine synthase n=1 Tax=Vasconcelosia minhoensis LEGE 07310 TaxID=915328 RepID=A0A8J7AXY2_9CYAN|nr:threonine synthase [Romeria gracilis]MBE9079638.1 threonine synthase [Romeria aff. gracilis LEGE 07310]